VKPFYLFGLCMIAARLFSLSEGLASLMVVAAFGLPIAYVARLAPTTKARIRDFNARLFA
jgi:hypothetical protein